MLADWIGKRLAKLRLPTLTVICAVLMLVSWLVPDPIPFVDELLLLAGTALLWRWRERGEAKPDEPAAPSAPPKGKSR